MSSGSFLRLCLTLCSVVAAFAQCHPPPYEMGQISVDDASFFVGSISISLRDFAPSKVVCLVNSLKERYRDRSHVLVYIFSSQKASRINIAFQEYGKETFEAFAQIHALYSLDADKHEEYVKILPAGVIPPRTASTEGPYSTRIDLPVTNTPHCRLEFNSRCLIALEDFDYPDGALARQASGKVALRATITRAGLVNHVRVVESESAPKGLESLLAKTAARNLSHWRLEPAARNEPIRITYSYDVDRSLRYEDGAQLRWNLPNDVAISQGPPK